MPRKFVISPTKLRTYYACPAMYRLEYVDKLGRFYHRARAGHAFGHSLHRALDSFHNAGGADAVTAEGLSASLEQVWVAKGYAGEEQEEAFREQGRRMLEAYHAAEVERRQAAPAEAPPKLFFTEKALRIDLTPDVALTGRIDRVDEHHDGALEIIDYKSGRETVDEEDVARSLAMSVYQLLVKHKHPDRRVFATLVALRTGAKASHELGADERTALQERCTATGEEIRTRDWEAVLPVVNENCPHCDFLPHCARHWRMQARREGTPVPEIALGV